MLLSLLEILVQFLVGGQLIVGRIKGVEQPRRLHR